MIKSYTAITQTTYSVVSNVYMVKLRNAGSHVSLLLQLSIQNVKTRKKSFLMLT